MDRIVIRTSDKGIDHSGKVLVTEALQSLIDDAAKVHGVAVIEKGTYLTAPLFLKSHVELHFEDGAVLMGTTDESRIPVIWTRVAGIEMNWYPGIINCNGEEDVSITGNGVIDGQGEYWWQKYWGNDGTGGLRREYDAKGLRWAADYDCMRVRNVVIYESENVSIKDITSVRSGFWNIHIVYSRHVHVDGVKVSGCGAHSPSTDGIDIDSCEHVLVENCVTSCNDDSICIKAGRDADGTRVQRPCHDIVVQNCEICAGFGVTLGSEVSGGIYDITIRNLKYYGTDCGFRIKSSLARKGYIRKIFIEDVEMVNVQFPFRFDVSWNPGYSICALPKDYAGDVPKHWEKLLEKIPDGVPNTQISDLVIRNVKAFCEKGYSRTARAFHMQGFPDMPIRNITLENVDVSCSEFGVINYVEDLVMKNVKVSVFGEYTDQNDTYDNR